MKFETQIEYTMTTLKNTKPEVQMQNQDGGGRHIGFHINRYNSAKYQAIFMKSHTPAQDGMLKCLKRNRQILNRCVLRCIGNPFK